MLLLQADKRREEMKGRGSVRERERLSHEPVVMEEREKEKGRHDVEI